MDLNTVERLNNPRFSIYVTDYEYIWVHKYNVDRLALKQPTLIFEIELS